MEANEDLLTDVEFVLCKKTQDNSLKSLLLRLQKRECRDAPVIESLQASIVESDASVVKPQRK